MNWDGLIGSVASVINTALPLLWSVTTDAKEIHAVEVGCSTVFKDQKNVLWMANFPDQLDAPDPLLINFVQEEGVEGGNLSVQLNFGEKFPLTEWLTTYTLGNVSIVASRPQSAGMAGPPVEGLWSYVTKATLSVGETIRAIVNPSCTLKFQLDVGSNLVLMTALGATTILGVTYMLTAKDNTGREGTKSGPLVPAPHVLGQDDALNGELPYLLELPSGDYSNGLHGFTIQLPIQLSATSVASDPMVKFEAISPEVRKLMKRISRPQFKGKGTTA